MKHLIALWLLAATLYFVWKSLPTDAQNSAKRFAGQHAPFILAGIFFGLGALVAAFYFGSTKLL
jgi:hypothetical protein